MRLEGKVALVSGAARGQGRSHAMRLAEEGADIIALDICAPIEGVTYKPSDRADLDETIRQVEALDRRGVAVVADVRDEDAVKAAVGSGIEQLGGVDIVAANAGITTTAPWDMDDSLWRETLDINLTGVWHTVKAALPTMIAAERGGSIILTSSLAGLRGLQNLPHYVASKHGVIGLMKTLAIELGPYNIRVNVVCPGNTYTEMFHNDEVFKLFRPDLEDPGEEDVIPQMEAMNVMGIKWMDPRDISNAVLFFASDHARYVTGVAMPVDGGWAVK